MEILTFHSLHESWQFSMYGGHLTAVSKCKQMVCSGTPGHKKMLLILVLSPVSYKWRRQVYGWYKLAYSHQVKLHQGEAERESLLLATTFKENAGNSFYSCVCMCVSSVLLYCLCGKRCSLVTLHFFSRWPNMLSSRYHPLPLLQTPVISIFPIFQFWLQK